MRMSARRVPGRSISAHRTPAALGALPLLAALAGCSLNGTVGGAESEGVLHQVPAGEFTATAVQGDGPDDVHVELWIDGEKTQENDSLAPSGITGVPIQVGRLYEWRVTSLAQHGEATCGIQAGEDAITGHATGDHPTAVCRATVEP